MRSELLKLVKKKNEVNKTLTKTVSVYDGETRQAAIEFIQALNLDQVHCSIFFTVDENE